MNDKSIEALATLLSRAPEWSCVTNRKEFNTASTKVVRVFKHTSGLFGVYAFHAQGDKVTRSIEFGSGVGPLVDAVAATCKLPKSLVQQANVAE